MSLDQRFDDLAQMQLREPTSVEHLWQVGRSRTRRRRAQQASVLVVVIAVATFTTIKISQRSGSKDSVRTTGSASAATRPATTTAGSASAATKPATTTAAPPPIPPSTILGPATRVRTPFTADNGALTVSAGKPPQDVSKEQAIGLVRTLLLPEPPNQAYDVSFGRVTLAAGLGVPALHNTPAWIIPYEKNFAASCPAPPPGLPQPPQTASKIKLAIITGPNLANVIMYEGAGTYLCTARLRPQATLGTRF